MRSLFSLIPLLLLAISCAGKSPVKTNFIVTLHGSLPNSSPFGGLVIFGTNGTEKFSRVLTTTSGSVTIELLKNSTWKLGAVSWMGAEAFTGEVKCAFQNVPVGSGDSLTINLTLSNAKCIGAGTAIPGTHTGVAPYTFGTIASSFCEGDITGRTTSRCNYTAAIRPIEKGLAGSYQFMVKGASGEILQSKCYRAGTDDEPVVAPTYNTSTLNIPAFEASLGFPMTVESYLSHDCDSGKGLLSRSLSDPGQAKIYSYTPGGNYLHVNTPMTALCAISDLKNTNNSPASGQGVLTAPFLICNEHQLFSLQSNFNGTFGFLNVKDAVYVLGRDLNLLKLMNGPSGVTPPSPCIEFGDTFLPIGINYNGSCNTSFHPLGSNSFSFDGNGHTISFLRMKQSNQDKVALFSQMAGNVFDVNFKHADIEGKDYAAVVVGSKTGNLVKMIRIEDSKVRGEIYAGAVFGYSNGSLNMVKVFVKNTEVEGDQYVGGIAGFINTGTFSEGSFSGTIHSDFGSNYVGGIIGKSLIPLDKMVSTGIIRARATNVGGITGAGGNITYSRSDMFINDFDTSTSGLRNFGGITGSTGSVTKSFFNGTIKTSCSGSCAVGALTSVSGDTVTDSFSTFISGLGGEDGDTSSYSVDEVTNYPTTSLAAAMCNGAGGCPWVQNLGDIPRLNSFELSGPEASVCSNTMSRIDLAQQRSAQSTRGSFLNPFVICRPAQLLEVANFLGSKFVLESNLNLSLFSAGDLTSFIGKLDGKNHILYGFKASNASVSTTLFTSIDPSSEIKDLTIAGFSVDTVLCSGCSFAPLAAANHGSLVNVNATDSKIDISGVDSFSGGLVDWNFGTIDGSFVSGDIASEKSVGGIACRSNGTIKNVSSHVHIGGMVSVDPNTSLYGGIVALNNGTLERSRFRGKIGNISNARFVGGIAGYLNSSSVLRDNEFHREAVISASANTNSAGGIAGYSAGSSVLLARNLSAGVLSFTSTPNFPTAVKSIVGENVFTSNNNLKLTTPQQFIESGAASNNSFNPMTGICAMDIARGIGNSGLTVFGMIADNDRFYFGTLVDTGSIYSFTTKTKNASDCTSISTVDVYKKLENPDTLNIANLKSPGGWDIADLGDANDRARAIASYIDLIQGNSSTNPPVWMYEADDEGLNLFLHD